MDYTYILFVILRGKISLLVSSLLNSLWILIDSNWSFKSTVVWNMSDSLRSSSQAWFTLIWAYYIYEIGTRKDFLTDYKEARAVGKQCTTHRINPSKGHPIFFWLSLSLCGFVCYSLRRLSWLRCFPFWRIHFIFYRCKNSKTIISMY